jgi:DNA polymerase-1
MKITLLIDADIIAYKCAVTNENAYEANSKAISIINRYIRLLQADHALVCLSDKTNWRKQILPTYKSNRKDIERPILLDYVKQHLMDNFESIIYPGLEADDVMGILSTHPTKIEGKKIIVSEDKDMRSIPGWLYNPSKDVNPQYISEQEADRYHLYQTLTGDSTDGYKGCPGAGPVKANSLLDSNHSNIWWEVIIDLYRSKELTEKDALQQAQVARICRASDYDFERQAVKLWLPKNTTNTKANIYDEINQKKVVQQLIKAKISSPNESRKYKLGDIGPYGGRVFYINNTGDIGIEAKTTDETIALHWSNAIIATSDYGNEWHLPSKSELALLYKQKIKVGGFTNTDYWCATEYNNEDAWVQSFKTGYQYIDDKKLKLNVRAIRSFDHSAYFESPKLMQKTSHRANEKKIYISKEVIISEVRQKTLDLDLAWQMELERLWKDNEQWKNENSSRTSFFASLVGIKAKYTSELSERITNYIRIINLLPTVIEITCNTNPVTELDDLCEPTISIYDTVAERDNEKRIKKQTGCLSLVKLRHEFGSDLRFNSHRIGKVIDVNNLTGTCPNCLRNQHIEVESLSVMYFRPKHINTGNIGVINEFFS